MMLMLAPTGVFGWMLYILVGVVWPATCQERSSGGRAEFEDIVHVAVKNEPCVGQHGCLVVWIMETNVTVAPVIDKHKNNINFGF